MKRSTRRKINLSNTGICEICGKKTYLVQHHIRGRKIQNANHPSNLANICSNCHADVHHGDVIIENRVFSTNGFLLLWHHKHSNSVTGDDAITYLIPGKE
jgi:hypothetical protein